jgi:signal transduction histidine kinase
VRNLGDLVPAFLGRAGALAAAAALLLGGRALRARAAGAGLEPLVDAAVVLALVVLLGPARAWAERAVASWLFQRDRARWDALTRVLHETVPDDGVVACCGRVLDAAVRLLRLRGAAVLLHDGVVVQRGSIALRAVPALWPRSPGELPAGMLPEARIRELPPALAAALAEAEINAVVPIASPRRHWGYGFVTTDLRGASFSYEEDIAISTFADQLARLLDAGDLVAHAVAVERSLAHAEKLAAIGETAARIAHEIRNPVTAARSLAQQMVREPASPLNAEAATVILEQLERVERQVRELLRFARREDLHAEPVDLGALVQHTLAELQARLDAAQVQVSLDIADGVVARADRERLRQVLVNLVENGAEALAAVPAPRTLAVSLAAVNGSARLRVADNGPGVPADALPRLFEPFFSCKPGGTGLGLAIVRRTVDAHGGRVRAESAAGAGAAFEVELPLGGAA